MNNHFARMAADEKRLMKRYQQELTGVAEGLLADGVLNDKEILFLKRWFEERDLIAYNFPGDIIYERLCDMLDGEVIDGSKRESLSRTLESLVGGSLEETGGAQSDPISFPIEQVDSIEFDGKIFCFTGIFLFKDAGKNKDLLYEATKEARGIPWKNVVKKLDYLVIGTKPDPRWTNTNFGNKIAKAIRYQEDGCKLKIIHEDTWVEHLPAK